MPQSRSSRVGLRSMRPRDPLEAFRSSSPLELFFDLVFVVAVSRAASALALSIEHGAAIAGFTMFAMVFFAIWWAWVNFTWFASAFDVDDWGYRLLTLTQMLGVIVLAIGVTPAADAGDFGLIVAGYVIMRLALVVQWIRASRSHVALRSTALRYVVGVSVVQLAWIGFLALPQPWVTPAFLFLVVAELCVPILAERHHPTPWHPGHVVDRYGSFTMIVLGESMLATVTAIAVMQQPNSSLLASVGAGVLAFALVSMMWWVYFSASAVRSLTSLPRALGFGYGHYFIFAAVASFSASVGLLVAENDQGTNTPSRALPVSLSLTLFLLGVWGIILRHTLTRLGSVLFLALTACTAVCGLLPQTLIGLVIVMLPLTAVATLARTQESPSHSPEIE